MPKKTKYKKILASYRNKLYKEQVPPSLPIHVVESFQKQNQKKPINAIHIENDDSKIITKNFKQDFTKSVFLILAIITLELILYFVSMNSNLRTIFKFIP